MTLEFLDLLSQIPDPRRTQDKKWQFGPVAALSARLIQGWEQLGQTVALQLFR